MEESLLLSLERRDILAILDRHPAQALRLLKVLCNRVRRADELLEDVVFMSLPSRLAKHLLNLGQMVGAGQAKAGPAEIRLSQQEVAEHLGISRESVNKVLSKWEEAGIVSLGRGRITLNRTALLQEIATPT
jgi:CRP-like cAMP-binding protein